MGQNELTQVRAGLDEPTTLKEILAECHALNKNIEHNNR
jgi:hypothetical protein